MTAFHIRSRAFGFHSSTKFEITETIFSIGGACSVIQVWRTKLFIAHQPWAFHVMTHDFPIQTIFCVPRGMAYNRLVRPAA